METKGDRPMIFSWYMVVCNKKIFSTHATSELLVVIFVDLNYIKSMLAYNIWY